MLEAGGDPAAAVRAGEEAVALTAGLEPSSIVAGCGSALAAALVATGEGKRATRVLLDLQGGPDLPRFFAGQRSASYEVLVRAALLTGDVEAAAAWAARAEAAAGLPPAAHAGAPAAGTAGAPAAGAVGVPPAVAGLPLAAAHARRARALVLLTAGDAAGAAALALESVAACEALGLAIESARGRILAGRALAAASDRDGAAEQLRAAEGLLVGAPGGHLRAEAVRELRRIGRRVNRAGRAGRADAAGPAALTARELEIARLVATGLTNRAVAETPLPEREDDRDPPRGRVRQARRAFAPGARRRARRLRTVYQGRRVPGHRVPCLPYPAPGGPGRRSLRRCASRRSSARSAGC